MPGMGANPLDDGGVGFRVWAPNAEAVAVTGTFNDFDEKGFALAREDGGRWSGVVPQACVGHEYRYVIRGGGKTFTRIDPYARQVTSSVGNGVIYRDDFDWEGDDFTARPWNELVIYELHIGTFSQGMDGQSGHVRRRDPPARPTSGRSASPLSRSCPSRSSPATSRGATTRRIFSPWSRPTADRSTDAFKRFVKAAHARGIAVILDVVYNHFGPSDLDLWRFDGWSENDKGGIYFYNDRRSSTPWGDTRPDYGRGEVRRFIRDNAMMWLGEFRADGLRYDMTLYMRTVDGSDGDDIPEGWSLTQWINREIAEKFPGRITIAEDLRGNALITAHESVGGANFGSQWDAAFVHPVRAALIVADDARRSMASVRDALSNRFDGDAFKRVVYTESHDEVANGRARVTSEVNPSDPEGWHARKRSTLGAGLVLTAPGIPMLFQGQTMLEDGWFRDTDPVDWDNAKRFSPA